MKIKVQSKPDSGGRKVRTYRVCVGVTIKACDAWEARQAVAAPLKDAGGTGICLVRYPLECLD